MRRTVLAALTFFSLIGSAEAATITAKGSVAALTDAMQIVGFVGTASFDEGPTTGLVPLTQYTQEGGLTWNVGLLKDALPGVTTQGSANQPQYSGGWNPVLLPPSGGGVQMGQSAYFAGVATFDPQLSITQVGLTANDGGVQYLTTWDKKGKMLGQVSWDSTGGTLSAGFVGIDTLGVPIGMVSYGNDDLWSGQAYDPQGYVTYSDTWVWATGLCAMPIECDDGNSCTTDTCDASQRCSHVNNTLACNDLDVCTTNDTCTAGKCVGTRTVCTAMDGCHTAGVCDPESGRCSNPVKDDGSACSDATATCLQSQTCMGGVCTGGTQVLCPPPSSCYGPGTCDATSGTCNNPVKGGASCDDGDKCTQTDTCNAAGQCVGQKPVVCTALDSCHGVGICNPATGVCSNPVKDGTSCDDGNKCTQMDSCSAGQCAGSPVVCMPADSCHDAGACDPTTGVCSSPSKRDGASCDDGDACTEVDSCAAGTCSGAVVTCVALDACHTVGTCSKVAGCSNPVVPDGTPCPGGACIIGNCVLDPIAAAASASAVAAATGVTSAQTGATTSTGSSGGSLAAGGSNGTGVVDGASVGNGGSSGSGNGGTAGQSTPTPAAAGGCGFATGGTEGNASWLLLGLLATARRRRRPAQG